MGVGGTNAAVQGASQLCPGSVHGMVGQPGITPTKKKSARMWFNLKSFIPYRLLVAKGCIIFHKSGEKWVKVGDDLSTSRKVPAKVGE